MSLTIWFNLARKAVAVLNTVELTNSTQPASRAVVNAVIFAELSPALTDAIEVLVFVYPASEPLCEEMKTVMFYVVVNITSQNIYIAAEILVVVVA